MPLLPTPAFTLEQILKGEVPNAAAAVSGAIPRFSAQLRQPYANPRGGSQSGMDAQGSMEATTGPRRRRGSRSRRSRNSRRNPRKGGQNDEEHNNNDDESSFMSASHAEDRSRDRQQPPSSSLNNPLSQTLESDLDASAATTYDQTAESSRDLAEDLELDFPEANNNNNETGDDDTNDTSTTDGSNPRYKTEMCRNFRERSKCIYGDNCQFAHGRRELREIVRNNKYKTKPCQKYWLTGYCVYGPRCNFLHNELGQKTEAGQQGQRPPPPQRPVNAESAIVPGTINASILEKSLFSQPPPQFTVQRPKEPSPSEKSLLGAAPSIWAEEPSRGLSIFSKLRQGQTLSGGGGMSKRTLSEGMMPSNPSAPKATKHVGVIGQQRPSYSGPLSQGLSLNLPEPSFRFGSPVKSERLENNVFGFPAAESDVFLPSPLNLALGELKSRGDEAMETEV